jgi:hypothetical protein
MKHPTLGGIVLYFANAAGHAPPAAALVTAVHPSGDECAVSLTVFPEHGASFQVWGVHHGDTWLPKREARRAAHADYAAHIERRARGADEALRDPVQPWDYSAPGYWTWP